MDATDVMPILAGLVRHALTTFGGMLVAGGYMDSSQTSAFVGGGMVLAGIAWSWWQKRGQVLMADELARLRATRIITPATVKKP